MGRRSLAGIGNAGQGIPSYQPQNYLADHQPSMSYGLDRNMGGMKGQLVSNAMSRAIPFNPYIPQQQPMLRPMPTIPPPPIGGYQSRPGSYQTPNPTWGMPRGR